MKAISLWQPWASLVALGEKQWETRSYSRSHRGPIAIHAAQTKEPAILYSRCEPYKGALERHGIVDWCELPLGSIIAVAYLERIVTSLEWIREYCKTPTDRKADKEYCFGDYSTGRFAWKLTDLYKLEKPIPYRGRQQLFNIDAATAERIEQERAQATGARRAHAIREYELFRDGSGPS